MELSVKELLLLIAWVGATVKELLLPMAWVGATAELEKAVATDDVPELIAGLEAAVLLTVVDDDDNPGVTWKGDIPPLTPLVAAGAVVKKDEVVVA